MSWIKAIILSFTGLFVLSLQPSVFAADKVPVEEKICEKVAGANKYKCYTRSISIKDAVTLTTEGCDKASGNYIVCDPKGSVKMGANGACMHTTTAGQIICYSMYVKCLSAKSSNQVGSWTSSDDRTYWQCNK